MSYSTMLTEGAISRIMSGEEIENPIFQVLGIKKLGSSGNGDRYRLLVSDGMFVSSFTMLATQLNSMVTDDIIQCNAIIKVVRYAISKANATGGNPKKIMVLLDLEIKATGAEVKVKIGEPKVYENNSSSDDQPKAASSAATISGPPAEKPTQKQQQSNRNAQQNRLNSSITSGTDITTTPIAALSPYQNKWVIKARVTNKSEIRFWNNSRGEGSLFSMDLIDESGEIRCTAFRDQVDKFYNLIEIQKVYYISRASIKIANKQFSHVKNDYEMALTGDSEIILCHDISESIPLINYAFTPIDKLATVEKDTVVDILAVVKNADDVVHLRSKAGKELRKRDVLIIDQSHTAISLTLWGNQADNFDGTGNPVVAVKSAKINEFNGGKSLSATMASVIQMDPDINEAHQLRGWFATLPSSDDFISITKAAGIGGGMNGTWMSLAEGSEKGAKAHDFPETFICKATINIIRHDNIIYKACPSDSCNKKVVEHDGVYSCEKCARDYQRFKPRLLANMAVSDSTKTMWASVFHDEIEKMVGASADELQEMKDVNPEEFDKKFSELAFQSFQFRIRTKMGIYNDQVKMNTTIAAASPVNYQIYNSHLLKQIKRLANVDAE